MEVKLLALDMDDTLLNKDLKISEKNKKALREAEDKGVIVVLASGRSPFAMEKYAKELGMHRRKGYKICYNGASIIRTDTHEEVYGHRLPVDLAQEVYEVVDKLGYPVQTYKGDMIYVSFQNEYTDLDCKLTGMGQEVVEDFKGFLTDAPVKFVIPGDPKELTKVEKLLKDKFKVQANIFRSKPFFLEVMPKEADKGSALRHLGEMMNIQKNHIMVIGDAMNDAGMIQYAGISVAMANAIEEIKQMADIITEGTNNEDGVAEVVEKYILKKG
ncbi:MAG: hypothetical protein PWQ37_1441 [Candidatus Petromonas sp.]|jgi:Cof subfamily protein (haloacid dehalogenase superfamily)|nr:hypothetical protein [Candidatus Petromonas sp.]